MRILTLSAVILLGGCSTLQNVVTDITGVSCGKQVELQSTATYEAGKNVVFAHLNNKINDVDRDRLLDDLLAAHDLVSLADQACGINNQGDAETYLAQASGKVTKVQEETE